MLDSINPFSRTDQNVGRSGAGDDLIGRINDEAWPQAEGGWGSLYQPPRPTVLLIGSDYDLGLRGDEAHLPAAPAAASAAGSGSKDQEANFNRRVESSPMCRICLEKSRPLSKRSAKQQGIATLPTTSKDPNCFDAAYPLPSLQLCRWPFFPCQDNLPRASRCITS